jgi:hypothetical protein
MKPIYVVSRRHKTSLPMFCSQLRFYSSSSLLGLMWTLVVQISFLTKLGEIFKVILDRVWAKMALFTARVCTYIVRGISEVLLCHYLYEEESRFPNQFCIIILDKWILTQCFEKLAIIFVSVVNVCSTEICHPRSMKSLALISKLEDQSRNKKQHFISEKN